MAAIVSKCVVWLTGPPCAGKTTIGEGLQKKIGKDDAEFFDGDVVRATTSKDLAHGSKDRKTNLDRVIELIKASLEGGKQWAIAAFVSPDETLREYTKEKFKEAGYTFLLIYIRATTEILEDRDVKGLYKRVRSGDTEILIPGFNDSYAIPKSPDLMIETDTENPDESVLQLHNFLISRND